MTGPQAPPGREHRPGVGTEAAGEQTRGGKSLNVTVTPAAHTDGLLARGRFLTPCMAAYGVPPADCSLNEAGYPATRAVQEQISALIVAAEARTAVSITSRRKPAKAEVVCARPSCRNLFTPRRKDQRTVRHGPVPAVVVEAATHQKCHSCSAPGSQGRGHRKPRICPSVSGGCIGQL
jgi:hypothetical protein